MREGRRSSERRFFCALLTLCARSTREFQRATPLRELLPASTSARTQLASCPRKSRCVTLPCELLWRISASEPTLRSCCGSVDTVACDPVPVSVPQISLAQALDVRLACGFVPRLTSMLWSIRGGGASRPARRGRRIHAYESYGKAIGPPARRCRSVGKTLRICVPRVLADGKMLAKCVPGRQSVASFSLHASRK